MGIGGLSSYINQHSYEFLQQFQLYDTRLAIDGQNIANEIYASNCDSFFGGDYAVFSKLASDFFDELLECRVTPIVVMDGGTDEEKISSYDQDMKRNIRTISNLSAHKKTDIAPFCLYEAFLQVARKKNIICVMALFDADAETAFVARFLDCPVLSLDSDFYIHDVPFINFNTLRRLHRNRDGPATQFCKIYKIDFVLEKYPNLKRDVLPLIAIFLGNDYVDKSEFQKFTNDVMYNSELNNNETQVHKLDNVLEWLQNHTLESAVTEILSVYDQSERQTKISIIQKVINKYLLLSTTVGYTVLKLLGCPDNKISDILRRNSDKPFRFSTFYKSEILDLSKIDLNANKESNCNYLLEEQEKINKIRQALPRWFLQRYHAAGFSGLWINTLLDIPLKLHVQVEDVTQPGCGLISFKIIRVIFKLLNNGTTGYSTLKLFTRGNGDEIETYELNCSEVDVALPRLDLIRTLSHIERKKVLLDTVKVPDSFLEEFPPAWRIFMAAMVYWKREADSIFTTNSHVYALLFILLSDFIEKYVPNKFSHNFRANNNENSDPAPKSSSIRQALESVDKTEFSKMKRFFDNHSKVDKRELNVTAIHAFSLFQNVLRNIMHLNALLLYPYPDVAISEFYDSSFIYNLYNALNKCTNLENYVKKYVFSNAPNLLNLFNLVVETVNSI